MSTPERGVTERELDIPLPSRRRVFVRIEDLPDPDGDPRGKRTRLREPSAAVIRLGKQYDENPEANVEMLWDIAAGLLPELTETEVLSLGYGTILSLLEIGKQPLEALERIAKNDAPPSA
jgi:hypothetical protein